MNNEIYFEGNVSHNSICHLSCAWRVAAFFCRLP